MRIHIEKLQAAVTKELKSGKPLDEVKKAVTMSEYSAWGAYKRWLGLNIECMAKRLRDTGQVRHRPSTRKKRRRERSRRRFPIRDGWR